MAEVADKQGKYTIKITKKVSIVYKNYEEINVVNPCTLRFFTTKDVTVYQGLIVPSRNNQGDWRKTSRK